jgi:hypothetical protein
VLSSSSSSRWGASKIPAPWPRQQQQQQQQQQEGTELKDNNNKQEPTNRIIR